MHAETQMEWESRMFDKVIAYLRDELCIDLPYMERALSALDPQGKENVQAFATEGIHLYYPPAHYLKVFEENELFLRRAYLHTVLHCLYAHLWQRGDREEFRWNVACDIAVEHVIDGLKKKSTHRLLSWQRQTVYEAIKEKHIISAAGIYELLTEEQPERLRALALEFYTDDHALWGMKDSKSPMPDQPRQSDETQKKWQKIARQVRFQKEKSDQSEDAAAAAMQVEIAAQKKRRSYKDFLMKFAAFQENMRCDIDAFDLNYYTYGLQIYGNLPLIEPLETREERRISEFVIVVDTSYSTSGELVRSFLQETLHILLEQNAFFTTAKVHLIQCDDMVQEDLIIQSAAQAQEILAHFEIKGGGNTDFRPAFTYVEQLRKNGELRNLGGLLYFTDGNGTYPAKKPDYPCAFLYLDAYNEEDVPAWAIQRKLDGEDRSVQ
ncbi:MAG: VWA-like domain-containing protein [bacterium]|nr:VWA-like domain-containing protein [bacterium]MDY4099467.1 VWA-like domain-containing protein [Lachnospiraceae bacterium]